MSSSLWIFEILRPFLTTVGLFIDINSPIWLDFNEQNFLNFASLAFDSGESARRTSLTLSKAPWKSSLLFESLWTCYFEAGEEATIRRKPKDKTRIEHQPCFWSLMLLPLFSLLNNDKKETLSVYHILWGYIYTILSLTLSVLLKKSKCFPEENYFKWKFFYLRKKSRIKILRARKIPFSWSISQ